jgi:hypothetical protein
VKTDVLNLPTHVCLLKMGFVEEEFDLILKYFIIGEETPSIIVYWKLNLIFFFERISLNAAQVLLSLIIR